MNIITFEEKRANQTWLQGLGWRNAKPAKEFKVIEKLPELGTIDECGYKITGIYPASLDPEQPNDRVYDYDYYEIDWVDINDGSCSIEYVAIENEWEAEKC